MGHMPDLACGALPSIPPRCPRPYQTCGTGSVHGPIRPMAPSPSVLDPTVLEAIWDPRCVQCRSRGGQNSFVAGCSAVQLKQQLSCTRCPLKLVWDMCCMWHLQTPCTAWVLDWLEQIVCAAQFWKHRSGEQVLHTVQSSQGGHGMQLLLWLDYTICRTWSGHSRFSPSLAEAAIRSCMLGGGFKGQARYAHQPNVTLGQPSYIFLSF